MCVPTLFQLQCMSDGNTTQAHEVIIIGNTEKAGHLRSLLIEQGLNISDFEDDSSHSKESVKRKIDNSKFALIFLSTGSYFVLCHFLLILYTVEILTS